VFYVPALSFAFFSSSMPYWPLHGRPSVDANISYPQYNFVRRVPEMLCVYMFSRRTARVRSMPTSRLTRQRPWSRPPRRAATSCHPRAERPSGPTGMSAVGCCPRLPKRLGQSRILFLCSSCGVRALRLCIRPRALGLHPSPSRVTVILTALFHAICVGRPRCRAS
jgi:hypothetical protein